MATSRAKEASDMSVDGGGSFRPVRRWRRELRTKVAVVAEASNGNDGGGSYGLQCRG